MRRPSQTWRVVSPGLADVGIRQLLVSPELPRHPDSVPFRRVSFTDPFTDRSADMRLLNLSRPPRSRRPLAGGAGSSLAKRPRSGIGLEAVPPAKIMRSEEDRTPVLENVGSSILQTQYRAEPVWHADENL